MGAVRGRVEQAEKTTSSLLLTRRREEMTQYLMSVHTVAGQAEPTGEELQRLYAQVDAFNQKVTDAGIWVFGGGLEPIEATTTVDATGTEPIITDGPVRRGQGVDRRLLDPRGARPRRGAQAGHRGLGRLRGARRGASVPARVSVLLPFRLERIFREEHGRVVASLIRRFGDIDIAEDAAAEALVAAVERWPADGVPPNPARWSTTTAARKAIDRIRRESHRDAKYQQAAMIMDDTPHEPDRAGRRRPPPADLHLLPPRPGPRGAGGADPAPPGRADRARDRLGVPGHRDDDGPAHHPREEEDRRCEDPLPGAGRRGPARPADRRAGGALPRLQRGLPRHLRARSRCGST